MPPSDPASWPLLRRRLRPKLSRFALLLAYDGAAFHGFQRQPDQRTVEGELVRALGEVGLPAGLSFASRTDAGVHAEGQVVVARAPAQTSCESLATSLGAALPEDVHLRLVRPAPAKFHPRWQAVGKRYRYTLARTPSPRAWSLPALDRSLFAGALAELARAPCLDGLTAAGAPPKPAPPLDSFVLRDEGDRLVVELEGRAFRRYALRHLIGAAVACAQGERTLESLAALAAGPPPYRALRAPADGLVLETVRYPPDLDPFA